MTSPGIPPQAITAEAVDDVATAIATTPPYRNPVMVTDRHRAEARRALEAATPHLAAFPRCPTACDGDCEQPCHEVHQPAWKRDHNPETCAAAIVAEAVAAERERCVAEIFTYADTKLVPFMGAVYRDAARVLLREGRGRRRHVSARIGVTAAQAHLPCGCATWLEWDDSQDAWVARRFTCSRHGEGGGT